MSKSHPINYSDIRDNIETMINLLEYDSMRSPGKLKLNSQHLHSLIWLQKEYSQEVDPEVKEKPGRKPAKKEG